jgi:hypothetical protein
VSALGHLMEGAEGDSAFVRLERADAETPQEASPGASQ